MKKLFSLALALVMIFALATTAMAAGITIDPNVPDAEVGSSTMNEEFNAYLIFGATYTADDDALAGANIAYTIEENSDFFDEIKNFKVDGANVFELNKINGTTTYNVKILIDDYDAKLLAAALKDAIADADPTKTVSAATDGKYTFTGLEKGYYIITSSLGAEMIVQTLGAVTINTKNAYPTLDKKISVDGQTYGDTDVTVFIGDTVYYELTMTVPATVDKAVTIHDVIEDGLTLNNNIVAKDASGAAVAFTKADTITDGCSFELEFAAADVAGKTVTITYSAELNADAEIVDEDDGKNTNKAWLTYSKYTTVADPVHALTYEMDFIKLIADTDEPLAGVEFELYDGATKLTFVKVEDGLYRIADDDEVAADPAITTTTLITPADGIVEVEGLKGGKSYTLKEIATVDGYNLLESDVTIEIGSANNMHSDSNNVIRNYYGTLLPSTGGVGTTIFTVVGAVLMGAAFILFVTKKKMANEQ